MKKTDSSEGKRNRKTQTLSALLSASALGLFLEGCGGADEPSSGGAGGGDAPVASGLLLTATSVPEAHIGGTGTDTVSYANSESPVVVSLLANIGTGGDAQGDTFENIENIIGSQYADTLLGDDEPNTLEGGRGKDALVGSGRNDRLYGGEGDDNLNGGAGDDTLYGGAGDDILNGGENDDTFYGGTGNDILYGDVGSDILNGGAGDDTLAGGEGEDTASYANADSYVHVFLIASEGTNKGDAAGDTFTDIENIIGSASSDRLYGDENSNTIDGGTGADWLEGGGGDDTLNGGAGNDTLYGGVGNDTLYGGAGNDTLYGGVGNDTLYGGAGTDTYYYAKGDGMDTATDVAGDDIIVRFSGFSETEYDRSEATRDTNNLVITLDSNHRITLNDAYYTDDSGTGRLAFTINAEYYDAFDNQYYPLDDTWSMLA